MGAQLQPNQCWGLLPPDDGALLEPPADVETPPRLENRSELRVSVSPRDLVVGVEADLWFSELVESRGSSFEVLDRGVAAVFRHGLIETQIC